MNKRVHYIANCIGVATKQPVSPYASVVSLRKILVLEDPGGPLYKSLSLSLDSKSLYLSSSSDPHSLALTLATVLKIFDDHT